jgi:hypothetical protein
MSTNESNIGFWVIIIAIGSVILYFGKEILTYIFDVIFGIFRGIQLLITDLIYVGVFIGVLIGIYKIIEAIRGK